MEDDTAAAGAGNVNLAKKMVGVKCPHCDQELGLETVNEALKESRFIFALTPKEGSLMQAHTVGGTMVQMEKFFAALGRDMGVKTTLMVEKIETDPAGKIEVHFLVGRVRRAARE